MCGIIGYVGDKPAVEILKNALTRLEYAVTIQPVLPLLITVKFTSVKTKAKSPTLLQTAISKICRVVPVSVMSVGLLTGTVTRENAHPHCDASTEIAVNSQRYH